ncbi:serine hydrolase domain-containing protein [Stackebrandtia nassauensis]|uniref:Beta-lactamase n=1 Tax=Stackebrandtia nassauensis (strain DSM 44728 / CIP 108903 / NRRL B-16338 / NBRC 102104 / LLR-40K-21) TaxID=446470 RepID=D3PUP2_STANL|nr:serine hydrolase domain-containing protein [Stackebrandtia nassauensis]ADD43055.1 beta-lactamase [Stackebrandtia nassauensis DSM 44728]
MRKQVFIAAAVAAVLVTGSAVALADPFDAGSGSDKSTLNNDLLNQKIEALHEAGAPGVIAEVRDGDGVWEGSAGERVIGDNKKPDPTDRVRVASLTKSMIATVTLQLADEGEVDLDAPIDEYLPDVLRYEETITVRQLLNHTSGLRDYFVHIYGSLHNGDPSDVRTNRLNKYTPKEIIGMATEEPLLFEPGTKFSYANTGYTVIGLLIEKLTGKSIQDAVDERVLEPAGMNDSYLAKEGQLIVDGPHPNGYFDNGDGTEMIDVSDIDPSQFWSGVAAVSSPRDINRFYRAMSDGTLLTPERLAEARDLTPQSDKTYGLGLDSFKVPDNCAPVPSKAAYGHTGDGLGYITFSGSSPDGERQVTFAFTLGYELNPTVTEKLRKAWRGLFYAGLCDIDTDKPTVAKTLPDEDPLSLQATFRQT